MEKLVTQTPNYRPDIEGLRGLAVALVVAYHATPRRFHGGFLGVDVFFVISGYLITGLLLREIEQTGRLSLAGFYARRARRLLPASALVLLCTILACSLFLSPLQQYRLGDSGTYTALYISNFWFLHQSTDYFAPAIATNPFLHTWSLAVEEQFYLVWPVIVLLGMRGLRSRRGLLAVMVFITLGSLAVSVWFSERLAPVAFFSPFARAWEFSIGGIALLLAPYESRVPRALRALGSWLGLAAILVAAVLLKDQVGWRGWHVLLPVLGTTAILHGRVPGMSAAWVLELPFMQWTGRVSYVWYLWHWPLLAVVSAMNEEATYSQRLHQIILCVIGSLALAAITHYLIENPIRFSRYLAKRRVVSLLGVGLITATTAGTATLWHNSATHTAHTLQGGGLLSALGDPNASSKACPAVGLLGSEVVECASGSPLSKTTVVLFGDSHAGQWYPAFQEIANERGWYVILIRKPACPTAELSIFSIAMNRPYTECDQWRDAAIKRIVFLRPAAVVMANRQLQNFSPGLKGQNETWREGLRKTLETMDSAGVTTILLRDTPSPGFDVPDCVSGDTSWWARHHASGKNPCMLDRAKALNEGIFRAEQEAAAGLPHVHVLDLSDLFCDGAVCPPMKNGVLVYSDESHISGPFARSIASAVGDRLAPLISNTE
ncbi:MAG: acyltransferase family protein [Terracidiphilus sp.]|jgi:peptidoglycan/LPS O-acetylase OafA/YrhL